MPSWSPRTAAAAAQLPGGGPARSLLHDTAMRVYRLA